MNDCDWVAAFDLESGIAYHLKQTGLDAEDGLNGRCELTDAAMEETIYCLDPYNAADGPCISFRERLAELVAKGQEFPCFFATTEF
jgi:hypothetical protein